MKIELIKETRPDNVVFYIEVNGSYLDNSLEVTEEKAVAKFEFAKANNGSVIVKEVLKSEEV